MVSILIPVVFERPTEKGEKARPKGETGLNNLEIRNIFTQTTN